MRKSELKIKLSELAFQVTQNAATTMPVPSATPSVANTAGTTITSETQLKTLMDGLTKLITTAKDTNTKQQPRRTKGGRKENKLLKTWRQYTYWCYTCGVNLTHNTSDGCIREPKRQGHNLEATRENPGGNTSRNHLWMQWSFDGRPYPKKIE